MVMFRRLGLLLAALWALGLLSAATPRIGTATADAAYQRHAGDEQMDLPGRVQGLINIPTLFAEDSPHSTYLCGEHQNARCGDKP